MRMKSFSLDSPESPSVQQQQQQPAGSLIGSASSVGPTGYATMQPAFEPQAQHHQQHGQPSSMPAQQQPQHIYQQPQPQPHMYLNQTSSAGYPPTHQGYLSAANYQPQPQQQSHQRQFDEHAGSSYWRQARQQYNHRHSYHNPPFHYQQQQHLDNSNSSSAASKQQTGANHNNGTANKDRAGGNHQHQHQHQKQRRDSSSAGLEMAAANVVAIKHQRAGSSSAPSGQVLDSAPDEPNDLLLVADNSPNDCKFPPSETPEWRAQPNQTKLGPHKRDGRPVSQEAGRLLELSQAFACLGCQTQQHQWSLSEFICRLVLA